MCSQIQIWVMSAQLTCRTCWADTALSWKGGLSESEFEDHLFDLAPLCTLQTYYPVSSCFVLV